MIADGLLKFASNQSLVSPAFLSLGAAPFFYPFPQGAALANALDQLVAMDKGNGYPIKARLDVRTSLTSADATLLFALAVGMSNQADGGNAFVVAMGQPLLVAQWTAGSFHEITIPKMPTGIAGSFRFMLLGLQVIVTAQGGGSALFTAGAVDARLVLDTEGEPKLYSSGWSA